MYTVEIKETTDELTTRLEEVLKDYQPNATYPKPPTVEEYKKFSSVKSFVMATATGLRLYLVGSAGIGKTSLLKFLSQSMGYRLYVWNMANMSVENLFVMFPSEEGDRRILKPRFYKDLMDPTTKKVIVLDEMSRADAGMANTCMELLSEGSIAGVPIPGLVTVIAADNPQGSTYGRMASLDFAQADRFTSIKVDANDTPWRYALAATFPDVDLGKLFTQYATFDASVREVLNPRVLEFTIRALLDGLPAKYALPMVNGVRVALVNRQGADVTSEVLGKVATALGVTNRESVPDVLDRVVDFALKHRQNIYLQGAPGIGKTKRIKAVLAARGVTSHYDSAAVLAPEDTSTPFPSADGRTLEILPMEKFATSEPWVWILDEIARGSRRTQNALMEPIQERTLGGEPTNLLFTIALNNPREVAGMKMDVGKNDLAQASRFALSVELDASDIPSATYLREVYGEDIASPFIEWWEDDLDDIGRVLCTPRCLERMIQLNEAGGDVAWALPYVNGDYVKVPLVELHARLDKRPLARLRQIVADVDGYADLLAKGKDEEAMAHAAVFMAFYKADLKQLEDVRDVCDRLYALLDRQHRIDLIRQGGDRQRFWNSVLTSAAASSK